jgi:hypothetical protein
MKKALMSISLLGLAILLILPALQFTGVASAQTGKWGIQIGTLLWFATAPFWMRSKS